MGEPANAWVAFSTKRSTVSSCVKSESSSLASFYPKYSDEFRHSEGIFVDFGFGDDVSDVIFEIGLHGGPPENTMVSQRNQ